MMKSVKSVLSVVCIVACGGVLFAECQTMMTKWGERVTSDNAWREYPRPQMVRKEWTCLNGDWDYAVTAISNTVARPEKWVGRIRVPFAVESPLSGVGRLLEPNEFLWYTRKIDVRSRKGYRTILHFDSVDFRAQVFLGHYELDVPHESANTPFSFDITDAAVPGENELTVCVWDPTSAGVVGSSGKQCLTPKGCFYTRASGILGSVWMEMVPETYLKAYRVLPDIDRGVVKVTLEGAGNLSALEGKVEVLDGERVIAEGEMEKYGEPVEIRMPQGFRLWSPESPSLYGLRITVKDDDTDIEDVVVGYFGMRKIEKRKDAKGIWRFYLNNRPYYILATLDQGWWPDGLLTPPSDEAMRFDIETLKKCGFNAMRKHIKVEPLRYYHHCDTIGLLVLQDMPSDVPERRFGAEVGFGPDTFRFAFHRQDWKRVMDHLYSVPSIVMWVPYNEGWGQPTTEFLSHATLDWTKRYDPSRLVDGPSGWNDFEGGRAFPNGIGWASPKKNGKWIYDRAFTSHKPAGACEAADAVDLHNYPAPVMPAVNDRRVSFLGEYGGIALKVKGHLWNESDKNYGYVEDKDAAALEARYLKFAKTVEQFAAAGLGGSVYTQTTDVEREVNGLLTYDRKVLKFNPDNLRKVHEAILEAARKAAENPR